MSGLPVENPFPKCPCHGYRPRAIAFFKLMSRQSLGFAVRRLFTQIMEDREMDAYSVNLPQLKVRACGGGILTRAEIADPFHVSTVGIHRLL